LYSDEAKYRTALARRPARPARNWVAMLSTALRAGPVAVALAADRPVIVDWDKAIS
jgi:hypothetical protein